MEGHQHQFMSDIQPLTLGTGIIGQTLTTIANWGAVYGIAYVIGAGLRLGWSG